MDQEIRTCQNCKTQFTIEPDDAAFYENIRVPPPTWCPQCRMVRRMAFRNERTLYRGSCALCGKTMLSMYAPGGGYTVYCKECWYSDRWDPFEYGAPFDEKRPLLAQLGELMRKVPRIGVMHIHQNTDCDYANYVADSKNVYLSASVIDKSENVFYSQNADNVKDCVDSFGAKASERIYEVVDGSKNYDAAFLIRSRDCIRSSFLFDCVNCQDCFMSVNLRSKRYVFRDVQCTKEDYEEKMRGVDRGSFRALEELRREFAEMKRHALHKFANILKAVNSSGDNIENGKDVKRSFDVKNAERVSYARRILDCKDVMDAHGAVGELLYETVASGYGAYANQFFMVGDNTRESRYFEWCLDSSRLFACVGLRNKHHCVLNQQYSKEEYDTLVPKIVAHMDARPYVDTLGREYRYGEFFPPDLSPFAYNETIAQEYFPLTRDEVERQGYRWRDPEPRAYEVTRKTNDLPDYITDVTDDILNQVIACAHAEEGSHPFACSSACATAFKIVPLELELYRRMALPLPRLCPNCRHYGRLRERNPLRLWHERCRCAGVASADGAYRNTAAHFHGAEPCPNEFETSYAPERPETIYCEQCYNAEVA